MSKQLFGIWLYDPTSTKPDESSGSWWVDEDVSSAARLAFTEELTAQKVAADNFGYDDYEKCRADGWCEVRPLCETEYLLAALRVAWEIRRIEPVAYRSANSHRKLSEAEAKVLEGTEMIAAAIAKAEV